MAKNKKIKIRIEEIDEYPLLDFKQAKEEDSFGIEIYKKTFKKWEKMKKIFKKWQNEVVNRLKQEQRKEEKRNKQYEKLWVAEREKEYKLIPKEWKKRMREINKKEFEEIKKEKMAVK